ncbi:MAG: transposase [Treponema sp.]|jgi:transposase|nr:transposase [Treponema sp.]
MDKYNPNILAMNYFMSPKNSLQVRYCALRAFFVDKMSADEIAKKFGYSKSTVYSLVRDFKAELMENPEADPFFVTISRGRRPFGDEYANKVVMLRKNNMSVPEIIAAMDGLGMPVSSQFVNSVLKKEGFARLPRRDAFAKSNVLLSNELKKITAEKSRPLSFDKKESFTGEKIGVFSFLPIISEFGIDKAIKKSSFPRTSSIGRLSSILSFLALKLISVKRYNADDLWCMDRGLGMFAGLNVLPKTAWFSSYSSSVTREMNMGFLRALGEIWDSNGLLGDTVNIDFTSIPYWGDGDNLENNWSGKRGRALASMLAILAQDSQNGIICYGDTTVRHENEKDAVLEFLDFHTPHDLKYLVLDSKMTTFQNLDQLNKRNIMFVTIRRRGPSIMERIKSVEKWKSIKVKRANGKSRNVKVFEEISELKGYDGPVRQIFMTGNGKIKPAIIITNDFKSTASQIVQKYARRWLVEKEIPEHIEFFHMNRNSSGMVIKVDFELTMTILAHNLYRLLAMNLPGYEHCDAETIYNKFINNSGEVIVSEEDIIVKLKKKRNLPMILEFANTRVQSFPWICKKILSIVASTTT